MNDPIIYDISKNKEDYSGYVYETVVTLFLPNIVFEFRSKFNFSNEQVKHFANIIRMYSAEVLLFIVYLNLLARYIS